MLFVNSSVVQVSVPDLNIHVAPGACCEVPEGYAKPRRAANGSRAPSTIELLAPQLVPADPAELKIWNEAPPWEVKKVDEPTSRVKQLVADGKSEGMAEVQAAAEVAQKAGDKLELTADEAKAQVIPPKGKRKAKV